MKNLICLLLPISILTSSSTLAQVDITVEPCLRAKDAISKEERFSKNYKRKKEDFVERNEITEKQLKKCKVETEIIDK